MIDLQVVEFASGNARGHFVKGLTKCISEERGSLSHYPEDWERKKKAGRRLFVPEKSSSYGVFLQRPLPEQVIEYCQQDVLLLPGLLTIYVKRLKHGIAVQLPQSSNERIALY